MSVIENDERLAGNYSYFNSRPVHILNPEICCYLHLSIWTD
jgi:hypothetical protein